MVLCLIYTCHVIVYSFKGNSRTLLCTLVLVDPYGRYYVLPFMCRNHILYIIPHDQLFFFDHSFSHSILFFILSYLSYAWCYSSFEVDIPLSKFLFFWHGVSDPGSFRFMFIELSSLFLWNKSHPSFLVGGCIGPFLQFKCTSCMVITISWTYA